MKSAVSYLDFFLLIISFKIHMYIQINITKPSSYSDPFPTPNFFLGFYPENRTGLGALGSIYILSN